MARFANIYKPQTEIGQGMNNAMAALFSGASPNERADREALAQLRMSQIGTEGEQQRLYSAKADEQERSNRGRADFRTNSARALTSHGVRLEDVLSYMDTGAVPSRTRFAPMGAGSGQIDAPEFTPEVQRSARTISVTDPLVQAGGGNAEQLANALFKIKGMEEHAGVLDGNIDPTRYAQANLKEVRDIKEGYDFNPWDPSIPPVVLPASHARHDPALQQKIEALVASGVPLPVAQGLAAGRYEVAIDPINGSRNIIDKSNGRLIGSAGSADGDIPVAPAASAITPDVDIPAATGGSGFFGNIANTIADALGQGVPFEKVEQGKNALDNLRVQTVTMLQDAVPGRPSNQLMQRLELLTINPGSLLQGDARSLDRMSQTRAMLATELERMQRDILSQPGRFRPEEVTKTRLSYSQLQQLLREYDTVINSFNRQKAPAPAAVPPQGGGWTSEKERRLQELRNNAAAQ